MRARSWLVVLLVLAAIVAGCGDSTGATEPPPVSSGRPTATPDESREPGATEEPSAGDESAEPGDESPEPGEASEEPDASADARDPLLGQVVETAVARLRLRAEPATDGALTATLPLGAALFVLDGPTDADGYAWFQVVRLTDGDAIGWVASASPDGDPWIAPAEAECPAAPETFEELRGLPAGVRLACFADTPITVSARLTTCNCDIDSATFDPEWFNITLYEGAPLVLAEPVGAGSIDLDEGLLLVLDPDGEADEPLPVDAVVDVTGVFDHPAARTCTSTDGEGESRPDPACRFSFAVTSLHATS
jgi:hypothetical protein